MPTFPEQVDSFLSSFNKKPEMGAVLEQLSEKKLFKPGVEEYFQAMQKAGMSSKKIVDTIYSDRKKYLVDKYPTEVKPTAAQQKQTQQETIGQGLLDVLSQGLQRQAGGVNQGIEQMTGMLPFGDFIPPQQVTPEQMLPPQQRGIQSLLQADPASATFGTMQKNFPKRFGAPPDPGEERDRDLREIYYKSLIKGKGTAAKREERLAEEGKKKFKFKKQEMQLKTDRLSLDNQKYAHELKKLDKANDYQSIKAINEIAKMIAPGQEITDEIFAQAIEKLKVFNPRFNELHKRAVKKKKGWFGKKTDEPTLKKPAEIDQYGDLF